jgi:hypothetical protein
MLVAEPPQARQYNNGPLLCSHTVLTWPTVKALMRRDPKRYDNQNAAGKSRRDKMLPLYNTGQIAN